MSPAHIIKRLKKVLRKHGARKAIDCVDLGSGIFFSELDQFAQKPRRKLHGIDRVYRKDYKIRSKSRIKLLAGDILERLKGYKNNSVKHFRMTMVLSTFPGEWLDPKNDHCLFAKVAEQVYRTLIPNGRFRIVDKETELKKAAKILEQAGFKVSEIRRLEEWELNTTWAEKYAAFGEDYWPHALVAVKRKGN